MRDVVFMIMVKLPTIFAICAAAWLAYNNKEGGGLVSFCCRACDFICKD